MACCICSRVTTGNLRQLNELARNAKADYIIHTGDFGFYDDNSLERIAEKYVVCDACPSERKLTPIQDTQARCSVLATAR